MYKNKTLGLPILLIAVVMLGVSSCRSYKKLADTPQIDIENIVRDDSGNKTDTTTIADIAWKDYFSDPKLQLLIEDGLSKNIDMQIALNRIIQAEASLSTARNSSLPTLSAGIQDQYTGLSNGVNGQKPLGYASNVVQLGLTASWEIDLWGKIGNQARAKYAAYLNTQEYRNLVQTNVVSNIAKGYYNLMALDEQLRITKETILLLEKNEETMEQLKEAGMQNASAVEASKALLYGTQLTIQNLEINIRRQEDALCYLLARKPSAIERSSLSQQIVVPELAYGVPLQLVSKRPDVRQAELSFKAAYALTTVARASLYPSLNISSASLGLASGNFSNLFKPEAIAASVIGGLTQPIFFKKQLRNNVKIAKAQQEEALLSFKNSVLYAGQEVSDILYSYQKSFSKNEIRTQQVASLTKATNYINDLLLAGESTYLEVITAQNSLLAAQLNQVNDKQEQLTYGVSLYKALGGGVR